MSKKIILFLLMSFSLRTLAKGECSDAQNRHWSSAGFTVQADCGITVSDGDQRLLGQTIEMLSSRFPQLFAKIRSNGFHQIQIRPSAAATGGGAVLAGVFKEQKLVVIYGAFFTVLQGEPSLKNLGYSVATIALLHEFLHAFDSDDELVRANLKTIGWDAAENSFADSFKIPELPEIANIWIADSQVARIKTDLGPLLEQLGPWEIYVRARERVKKFGYPSIYSVVGGPVETFAELGAYIALDPSAPTYIRPETIRWFKVVVLK